MRVVQFPAKILSHIHLFRFIPVIKPSKFWPSWPKVGSDLSSLSDFEAYILNWLHPYISLVIPCQRPHSIVDKNIRLDLILWPWGESLASVFSPAQWT